MIDSDSLCINGCNSMVEDQSELSRDQSHTLCIFHSAKCNWKFPAALKSLKTPIFDVLPVLKCKIPNYSSDRQTECVEVLPVRFLTLPCGLITALS